jgi:hypothetical protein
MSPVSERLSIKKMVTSKVRVGKYLFDVASHRKGCASYSRLSARSEIASPLASLDQLNTLAVEESRCHADALR